MMQLFTSNQKKEFKETEMNSIINDLVDHERDDYNSNFIFVRHVIMQPYIYVNAVKYNAPREHQQIVKLAITRFLKLICRQPEMTCSNEEINHELLLDKLNKEQLKAGIIKVFWRTKDILNLIHHYTSICY
jgi:hypothetical protein